MSIIETAQQGPILTQLEVNNHPGLEWIYVQHLTF